ncbi:hypothetical protein HD598_000705 [Neomicrococcus aestuarii]|uniref:AbiEi antitoxin C-terminal domain-containing protein n=1 Tax=Neomicrococcus aestuarii TaxID=556325 RepID=A0A7W8TSM4_9MICC|nr:hypothetical protein [Neomicrococcus aestuarii]MBB5512018.1 hypothetical protein [Neomicrococcus aestuarii]
MNLASWSHHVIHREEAIMPGDQPSEFSWSHALTTEFMTPASHDHTQRELEALALDQHLFEILPGTFVTSHTVVDPGVRLLALATTVGETASRLAVFSRMTAAWIYGCVDQLDRIQMHVGGYHRPLPNDSPMSLLTLEAAVDGNDSNHLGSLRVTNIERTAFDLALFNIMPGSRQALVRLIARYGSHVPFEQMTESLEQQRRYSARRCLESAFKEAARSH